MTKTCAEIVAARHAVCTWDEATLTAALRARFPQDPIDLSDLCDSWIADQSLTPATLRQCAHLLAAVAGLENDTLGMSPRDALTDLQARL